MANFSDRPVTNNTPPTFSSAAVNGATLTVTFDGGLDESSVPAPVAFTVTGAGADQTPTGVAVNGAVVTLTLGRPAVHGETVTVTYTPGTNPLRDADNARLPVPAFTAQTAANNTPADTTPPRFVSATINGATVTVTFTEALKEDSQFHPIAGESFLVSVGSQLWRPTTVDGVTGATVTMTLPAGATAAHGEVVQVEYLVSTSAQRLQDLSGNKVANFSDRPVTNNTPPTFSSAAVNGATLTITFNGGLDEDSEPAPAAFTVTGAGADQTPTGVAVSGATVALTLGRRAVGGETVTVGYDPPAANPLRDADMANLPVPGFSDSPVTNNTAKAPAIDLVRIVSHPTWDADGDGAFDTYIEGDSILIDVEFSEPVEVTGGGDVRLRLDVGGDDGNPSNSRRPIGPPTVVYGGETLRFAYMVRSTDADPDGVWVQTDASNRVVFEPHTDQRVVSATTGAAADLTKAGLPTTGDPRALVDGNREAVPGPTPSSATVNADTLRVVFDKSLDTSVDTHELRFALAVQGAGTANGGNRNASQHPTRVSVSGATLTLVLGTPARAGETVTLTYDGELLRGTDGKRAPQFRDLAVTNNTPTGDGPSPFRAAVVRRTLELEFDGALDEASAPPGSAFSVAASDANDDGRAITATGTATVSGRLVTVTLAEGLRPGELATVSYTQPGTGPRLQGAGAGNPAVLSFDGFRVGTVVEGIPPKLDTLASTVTQTGSSPAESRAVLSFDEALDESSEPAARDFAVTVGGGSVTISGVAVDGRSVVLTLDRLAPAGTEFAVSYGPGTNPIRDEAGNAAAPFAVTLTARAGAGKPQLQSVTVYRARLALAYDKPLDPGSLPATGAFTFHHPLFRGERVEYTGNRVVAVEVEGSTAVLTLAFPVYPCTQAFTVTYTKPSTSPLQSLDGTAADGFMHHDVVNEEWRPGDNCAIGWATRARVGSIILTARRPFAKEPAPRAAWFTVAASGGEVTVTGAAFSAADPRELRLTLSRDIAAGETVTMSYTRPAGEPGLWDADGNQLADIEDMAVENRAAEPPPAPAAPTLAQASETSVEVSWTAPDADPPVTGYDVQYRPRDAARWTDHGHAGTATSATIGGLEAGRSWDARVRARNAAGAGAWSEPGAGHTGPARFVSAETVESGRGLYLTFTKEILLAGLDRQYTVRVDGETRQADRAFWEDNRVGLRLAEPVRWGETVTVAYAKPSSGPMLHDADRLPIESFGPEPVTNTVPRPPLTAAFHDVPASHGGKGTEFSFELRFSENFGGRLPYRKLRDEAVTATNARVTGASRVSPGQNQRWTITVRPQSSDSVAVTLAATTDCGAAGAICTPDGRPLSNSPTATIQGPSADRAVGGDAAAGDAAGDSLAGDAGRDSLALVAEALEIADGLTPDEGAAALFGERPLSEPRRAALDHLGNSNGRYDLGDLLSWIERCRSGEARCGERPADPGPASRAALGAAALVGAAAAGARGNSKRRRPHRSGRGRPGRRRSGRRRRGRAAWALAMLVAAATVWSCTGDLMGPTADDAAPPPVGAAPPPAASRGPGFLTVEFTPPPVNHDIGVLLRLEGPGIKTVQAPGLDLYQSEASGPRQIIVAGPLRAGPLLRFRVPDRSQLSLYRVHVLEVTGEGYGLRNPTEYRAAITPN